MSASTPDRSALAQAFPRVRATTRALCAPLSPEDCSAQSMEDASPAKWHLAHTTWFFETFVLEREEPGFAPFHPAYRVLFNSYYQAVGEQHPRPRRGLVTRPGLDEVLAYRDAIDARVATLLADGALDDQAVAIVELGLHHEQQHQELLLTDVKHLLGQNPLHPVYREAAPAPGANEKPLAWSGFAGGVREIGFAGAGFRFDNETPRHPVVVAPYELATRPVSCGDYLAFMGDAGYSRPELWLSDGWATVSTRKWRAPLYWVQRDGEWWEFTLSGLRPVRRENPVCHVSYYEADAYARWAAARLPTEAEWETAAAGRPVRGHFVEDGGLHPQPAARSADELVQLFGDVWEWTASPYAPYPGYRPPTGALGEYNGKFMCNQLVLRGGSCATASAHVRPTYRNFFYPDARWQFSGFRLARDAS